MRHCDPAIAFINPKAARWLLGEVTS